MKTIYISFIRSLLKQSATVCHSSLSQQSVEDLVRVQKYAFRVILQQKFKNCKHALQLLEMDSLHDRCKKLSLYFTQKCLINPKFSQIFKKKEKAHLMKTREAEQYDITFADTSRLKNSQIVYMQRLLTNARGKQLLS